MNKNEFPEIKISFEIESLGPIRDSKVHFKPFLIFSGESNTGKSYAAIAIYYLFFMLNNEKLISESTSGFFDKNQLADELNKNETVRRVIPYNFGSELERVFNKNIDQFVAYMLGYDDLSCKIKLKVTIPESEITYMITKDPTFGDHIGITAKANIGKNYSISTNRTFGGPTGDLKYLINYSYTSLCNKLLFGNNEIKAFFLPPARGAFSGLAPSMLKNFSSIGIYNEFLEGIDSVRFRKFDTDNNKEQKKFINPLLEKLLNGKIKVERDNVSYAVAGSDTEIPLSAASSSVKELFPLYLLLNRLPIDGFSLCIEEPEAHLHPELQRSTAQVLSYIVNNGSLIQATTHSDFFINQVNNLLKLHFLKIKNREKFFKILKQTGIEEEFVLDPQKPGAYYFEKNKDSETIQIKALEITEKGIPMSSFNAVYDRSVKETRDLREALIDDEE